jgi:hypothetical protein
VGFEICYWICTFSNNQWRIPEELGKEIRDSSFYHALQSPLCRGAAMVMDDTALPLKRVWCLFEIMTTYEKVHSDPSFVGAFICSTTGVLNTGSASMDVAIKIAEAVVMIDLTNAGATNQSDKDAIFDLVRQMDGGFTVVNGFVRTSLLESLVQVHAVCELRFDKFLQTMQSRAVRLRSIAHQSREELERADISPTSRSTAELETADLTPASLVKLAPGVVMQL